MVVDGLQELVKTRVKPKNESELLAWMDLVLESLHQNSMLSKLDNDDDSKYADMVGSMFSSFTGLDNEDYNDFDV